MNNKSIIAIICLGLIVFGLIWGIIQLNTLATRQENIIDANARTIGLIMTDKRLENRTDFIDYYIDLEKLYTVLTLKLNDKNFDEFTANKRDRFFLNIIYTFKKDLDERIIGDSELIDLDEELIKDIYDLNIIIKWYFKNDEIDVEELLSDIDLREKYLRKLDYQH
jgi:hypothetical protein